MTHPYLTVPTYDPTLINALVYADPRELEACIAAAWEGAEQNASDSRLAKDRARHWWTMMLRAASPYLRDLAFDCVCGFLWARAWHIVESRKCVARAVKLEGLRDV